MSKIQKYNKDELKRVRKNLPPRWATSINDMTGYSISYIRKTLYGVVENQLIMNAAFKLISDYLNDMEKNKNTFKNL